RQPKKAKRKKLLKRSDPLPAKRLRTDHPSLASGTGGKSLAYFQPCLEQLSVPIYHADVNAVAGGTSLSFALLNVHTRVEGAKKHAAALRQLMVDIVCWEFTFT
ncbi:hypothetical protein Tco_0391499, partial [Tanacetum coccineum]